LTSLSVDGAAPKEAPDEQPVPGAELAGGRDGGSAESEALRGREAAPDADAVADGKLLVAGVDERVLKHAPAASARTKIDAEYLGLILILNA
jgi:hypothetical protein